MKFIVLLAFYAIFNFSLFLAKKLKNYHKSEAPANDLRVYFYSQNMGEKNIDLPLMRNALKTFQFIADGETIPQESIDLQQNASAASYADLTADVIVFAFQEAKNTPFQGNEGQMARDLGLNHERWECRSQYKSGLTHSLVNLTSFICYKRQVVDFIIDENPEGISRTLKLKGAVGLCLKKTGSPSNRVHCLLNSHLDTTMQSGAERIKGIYDTISQKLAQRNHNSFYLYLIGDLNVRLLKRNTQTVQNERGFINAALTAKITNKLPNFTFNDAQTHQVSEINFQQEDQTRQNEYVELYRRAQQGNNPKKLLKFCSSPNFYKLPFTYKLITSSNGDIISSSYAVDKVLKVKDSLFNIGWLDRLAVTSSDVENQQNLTNACPVISYAGAPTLRSSSDHLPVAGFMRIIGA